MNNIVPHPRVSSRNREIGHYVRLGDTGHKILEDLVAEGRFPARRVVVDASRHKQQSRLIDALASSDQGVELILDTKCAELATPGKFGGAAKDAPWSVLSDGNCLGKEHFPSGRHSEVLQQIAEFAVENRYSAVLSTGHMLRDGPDDEWFKRDIEACYKLIDLLDILGADHIDVDYSLLISHTLLNDPIKCAQIIDQLRDIPFQNLWIRASGFGSDSTPLTTQRYLRSVTQFHELGKPVIADYLGGLIGTACIAFGGLSGMSHGVGERQRFDASDWFHPPKPRNQGFRRATRMTVPGIQTSLTLREIDLLSQTPAGRRLVSCNDRHCCENGVKTMLENPRRHWFKQVSSALDRMAQIPLEARPRDFLGGVLSDEVRAARELSKLRPNDEKLIQRLENNNKKMNKLYLALEKLAIERESSTLRPHPVPKRTVQIGDARSGGK